MAHHKSAIKRIQVSERQNERNRMYKTKMKTAMKKVLNAQTKADAAAALNNAVSVVDKLVAKGIIAKNTAANRKSRLMRHVNAMS